MPGYYTDRVKAYICPANITTPNYLVCWETATRAHAFKVCSLRQNSGGQRGTGVSASHPPRRPLVFAPVCDPAPLTARDEFEDDFLVAI